MIFFHLVIPNGQPTNTCKWFRLSFMCDLSTPHSSCFWMLFKKPHSSIQKKFISSSIFQHFHLVWCFILAILFHSAFPLGGPQTISTLITTMSDDHFIHDNNNQKPILRWFLKKICIWLFWLLLFIWVSGGPPFKGFLLFGHVFEVVFLLLLVLENKKRILIDFFSQHS